ncbi:hypothetical protein [Pseudobacillus wudalianchiensis]|uniref:Uncharacterized protein n=1 Tax=Pseudobacillus wudalianchiensis TaxID=1743143 RepID=A0A1B9ATR8_9BACI|nr:hypothetical protein [Bacillus wudalianchiensis]OCA87282.1 hypothetical protein A8F95_08520 [Bacillus wudalianchiensis]
MPVPVITIKSVSRSKISKETGVNRSTVVFAVDQPLANWEARADGQGVGQGDLVGIAENVRDSWKQWDAQNLSWSQLNARRYKWADIAIALPAGENILLNPSIDDPSWVKSYNTNIMYTQDGPVAGAVVATFEDANTDGSAYWYCYEDKAPQKSDTYYLVGVWVKAWERDIAIKAYTADNTEAQNPGQRINTPYLTVKPIDGWKYVEWLIKTHPENISDSLSFHFSGLTNKARMSLSSPSMIPVGIFDVDFNELTWGDREYRINVYGKNAKNEWTPYQS